MSSDDDTRPDDAIRSTVVRLSRPHPSGGRVIERAAIMAAGDESAAIMRWIADHHGEAETTAPKAARGGLHADREQRSTAPQRYVLPAGSLS